jgi:hypothetical protein
VEISSVGQATAYLPVGMVTFLLTDVEGSTLLWESTPVAHGGQVVLSETTRDLVADRLLDGAELVDLGVHRLRDLGHPEHVFGILHPALPVDISALRSLGTLSTNLPSGLTSFVGRSTERVEVGELLGQVRLLTLTGAGGCGKTRLALQAADGALEGRLDAVWWGSWRGRTTLRWCRPQSLALSG